MRAPETRVSYGALIGSMARLAASTPILRLRAFYQSCLFAAFSLFWTTTPLLLAVPDYRVTQRGIALFALAGVSGAIAAPIAGRLADRGFSKPATGAAIILVAAAFLSTMMVPQGSSIALAVLVAAAIGVDFGVQGNFVLGFAPFSRSRPRRADVSTASISRPSSRPVRSARPSALGLCAGRLAARRPHRPRAAAHRARSLCRARDLPPQLMRLILATRAPHEPGQSPRRECEPRESLCLTKS